MLLSGFFSVMNLLQNLPAQNECLTALESNPLYKKIPPAQKAGGI